jgi:hypothetical protein
MANHMVLHTDLYPVASGDAPEQKPCQVELLTSIVHQLASHVETLSLAATPTKHTTSANPTTEFDRAAGGRREHDALSPNNT